MLQLTFNPGLTLTGFRTTRPSVVTFLFCFTFSFKFYTERSSKNIFIQEKLILGLPFNPGLTLTALRTTQP